jgi:hypothetical protein
MVAADGRSAKIGACERASNAEMRLRRVEGAHRKRHPVDGVFPLAIAVVAEIEGLVVSGDDGEDMWSITTHLEGAMRLVLARRRGRLAVWTDWIHVDRPISIDEWEGEFRAAWAEVSALGSV